MTFLGAHALGALAACRLSPVPPARSARGIRRALVALSPLVFAAVGCDGTLAGIGRRDRPPEVPLPPAPVEAPAARAGEGAGAASGEELEYVVAQHLLVMYEGSRSAPPKIKRTRDEARARAAEALDLIKKGQDFDKVVSAYTDEPGGAAKRGDLGRFSREMMVKPFSDAAFALDVGQVSAVIESPFGFHVIRRNQ